MPVYSTVYSATIGEVDLVKISKEIFDDIKVAVVDVPTFVRYKSLIANRGAFILIRKGVFSEALAHGVPIPSALVYPFSADNDLNLEWDIFVSKVVPNEDLNRTIESFVETLKEAQERKHAIGVTGY